MCPCARDLTFFRKIVNQDAIGQTIGGFTGIVSNHFIGDIYIQFTEVDLFIGFDARTRGCTLGGHWLKQSDNILGLLLEKSIEGLGFGGVLPITEANCDGEDSLTILGNHREEEARNFTRLIYTTPNQRD